MNVKIQSLGFYVNLSNLLLALSDCTCFCFNQKLSSVAVAHVATLVVIFVLFDLVPITLDPVDLKDILTFSRAKFLNNNKIFDDINGPKYCF
jgi:hypothetical protein